MTQIVVVERSFAEPTLVETLAARERLVAPCLRERAVTWLETLASRDQLRMLCFYRAPDTEAVRYIQEQAGLPYDRAWSGRSLAPPRPPESPSGYATVVVERAITTEFTETEWWQRAESSAWCLAAHRVTLIESVFAPLQGRATCVFSAPDAEAVRSAAGPAVRVWPATVWRPD